MNNKLIVLFLWASMLAVGYSKPPVTVRGANNQIVGRVYQYDNSNSYRYYGKNYESLGSSRQVGSYHYYYGSNNQSLGKVYTGRK
jgi:hypothetical protein